MGVKANRFTPVFVLVAAVGRTYRNFAKCKKGLTI